ncbi:hypothetical protein [Hymenobacter metallilatus]|uniref:Uncharacterized protein n=1 Tax=Hymenobacter metallilatus TaxID=2493666 RepID=A0A3R9NHY2_9BACT|nr:hypothetical protein [Hymenobacter metallilatus]RSK33092.1 hypothetical protein EI290_10270 [Hymenobacter metallilatus]
MALTDDWKTRDWGASEFSYAAPDLRAALRRSSQHNVAKLLRAYRRQFGLVVALTAATLGVLLLQPGNPQYQMGVGLILLYCLVQCAYLTLTFRRFRLPDLTLRTTEAIQETLALARAINRFQAALVAYFVPLVFLGSLLATLSYYGWSMARILGSGMVLTVIGLTTTLMTLLGHYLRRFLVSRQCMALIAQLEASRRDLLDVGA